MKTRRKFFGIAGLISSMLVIVITFLGFFEVVDKNMAICSMLTFLGLSAMLLSDVQKREGATLFSLLCAISGLVFVGCGVAFTIISLVNGWMVF